MKFDNQLKDWGSLNFGPLFKNKWFMVIIIYYIYLTSNAMSSRNIVEGWRRINKKILVEYLSDARCRGVLELFLQLWSLNAKVHL